MKYQTIVLVVFIGCLILAFLPLLTVENDKTCLTPERQYIQAQCVWTPNKQHGVCRSDEIEVYFNLSGEDNLTETEIDSLAEEL